MLQKQAKLGELNRLFLLCMLSRKNLSDNKSNNIGAVDWLGRVNLRTIVAIVTHLMMS